MSKGRTATRFAAAGAVTALYGAAAYAAMKGKKQLPSGDPKRVVIVAGALTVATWIAALA